MNFLQIHRSLVRSQTAPEQKNPSLSTRRSENQKMKSGVSILIFALFMILFPSFFKRGRYMSSEFQSDFESVTLYSADKIVTYIVGSGYLL
jgi:hypothetical protein